MKRSYRYRLYPNKNTEKVLSHTLEACRQLYNVAREQRILSYQGERRSLWYNDQQNQLPEFKQEEPFFGVVYSQVLQDVLRRLDFAFSAFFKRVSLGIKPAGFPRYKQPNRYHSFKYPQATGFAIKNVNGNKAKLRLGAIGSINLRYHREIPNEAIIKTCTVIRKNRKWYASISVVLPDIPKRTDIGDPIGIDAGLENLLTLSTDEFIENPRHYNKSQDRLAIEQRKLSRMEGSKKGQKKSNNFKKQSLKVSKVHEKIANQRLDRSQKLSRDLVNTFPYIKVEALKIKNMVRNKKYSKSILDAGWGQIFLMLGYKVEDTGGRVEFVNPKGTTQICWNCGEVVPKDETVRIHNCPYCGFMVHRDFNAALNISSRVGTTRLAYSSQGDRKPLP